MAKRSPGVAWGNWLVSKTSGMLDARLSRRSFIARTTLLGSAVAATGCAVITQPGTPYQSVAGCSGGLCTDGYTEFCCVINDGVNACPPGSTPGGWWRADGSIYCGGGSRYYIDCNEICCGPVSGGFCAGCSPCRCAVNCDTRRVHCNYFRYGQCNVQIPIMGPIACRMVLCTPPYPPYTLLACGPSSAVDDATANHNADCAAYVPPPPPPPPLATAAPSTGAAVAVGANPVIATRGSDGDLWYQAYTGTDWSAGWKSLGGQVNSNVVGVAQGANASLFLRGIDDAIYSFTDTAGTWSIWNPLGGVLTSDPAAVVDQSANTWVFARGTDYALYVREQSGGGWTRLGGRLASDPTAVAHAGNLSAFLLGTENDLWSITQTGGTWGALGSLGGTLTSNPAAVVDTSGTVWVFARGVGNGLWGIRPGVGAWTPYGGDLAGDPAPVVDSTGTVWVFARMADQSIQAMSTATPGTWVSLGPWPGGAGTFVADPSPVLAGANLWVFGLGADYSVWAMEATGSDFTAKTWEFLGGVLVPVHA